LLAHARLRWESVKALSVRNPLIITIPCSAAQMNAPDSRASSLLSPYSPLLVFTCVHSLPSLWPG
jgi:hypothetical protein